MDQNTTSNITPGVNPESQPVPTPQATNSMVYGAPKTKKPMNKPLIIGIIVIIVLVIAAIIGVVIVNNHTQSQPEAEEEVIIEGDTSEGATENAESTTENAGSTTKVAEQKITNQNRIRDLANKVQVLVGDVYDSDGNYDLSGNARGLSTIPDYYFANVFDNNLTDAQKLGIAITYVHAINRHDNTTSHTYAAQEVADVYKALFGTNVVQHQSGETNACVGAFTYDANSQTYILGQAGCGGTLEPTDEFYIYDFTAAGDKAYVYLAAGSTNFAESGAGYVQNYYDDITSHSGRKLLGNSEPSRYNLIKVDNYKDFTKYRFVFEKDVDGNYYFTGVEKI